MINTLFSADLKRLDLLKIKSNNITHKIKIAIYRNHSFEIIASVLNSFLNFSKLEAEFVYSDYDDSLNFQVKDSDFNIIWLDIDRYKTPNIQNFIFERLMFLRSKINTPILLLHSGENLEQNIDIPDCYIFSVNDTISKLNEKAYDLIKEEYSGTKLSNKACLLLAQTIGLKYIPSIMLPNLKAIILDLDNTLYEGVLGEDGYKNVILSLDHIELQKQIKNLKVQGFFICLASKNEEQDVKKMFFERKDFILKWEDFTVVKINWDSKAQNILAIAKTLNIGVDSILFIDDNPAEIQNISSNIQNIETILARDPKETLSILKLYPRLLKLKISNEDKLRSDDIKANLIRNELVQTLTLCEYFKKLGIKLIYNINNNKHIPRIVELLNKTNQFIFTYKRYREVDINEIIKKNCIITVSMSDNLSDSGIIGILVAHNNNDLILDELAVSCRALGRNLEDVILPQMFMLAKDFLKTSSTIKINYKKGERNTPAINWLSSLVNKDIIDDIGVIDYKIPSKINTDGLNIEVINPTDEMPLKFHHIGVATNNIEKEFEYFKKLGYEKSSEVFFDEIQKIKGFFISAQNQPTLELLENLDSNGPLNSYHQKSIKFYHFAYETKNIENDLGNFIRNEKAIMIAPITQATYFKRICFLMLRNKMIIELIETIT